MKLRRLPIAPEAVRPLTEAQTLILLLGYDATDRRRGSTFRQLAFAADCVRSPEVWARHEQYLLDQADRLGINRPAGGYFWAEAVLRKQVAAVTKWAARDADRQQEAQHGDDHDD